MADPNTSHSGDSLLAQSDPALLEEIYAELKRIAAWHLSAVHQDISLGATDLTHEAIGRVLKQRKSDWNDDTHLLAIASLMVRRALHSHLRARTAQKRGGPRAPSPITLEPRDKGISTVEFLSLCEAIEKLDDRQAAIVQMRFFGGMNSSAIARFLGISVRSVQLECNHARLWLARELSDEAPT